MPKRDYFLNRQAGSESLLKYLFTGSLQNTYARRVENFTSGLSPFQCVSEAGRREPHGCTGGCGSLGSMLLPDEQMLRQQEIKDFKIHSIHIHIHPSEMSASMALFRINLHWQELIEASGWVLQCF